MCHVSRSVTHFVSASERSLLFSHFLFRISEGKTITVSNIYFVVGLLVAVFVERPKLHISEGVPQLLARSRSSNFTEGSQEDAFPPYVENIWAHRERVRDNRVRKRKVYGYARTKVESRHLTVHANRRYARNGRNATIPRDIVNFYSLPDSRNWRRPIHMFETSKYFAAFDRSSVFIKFCTCAF